jgi:hypothetical protein
MKSKKNKYKNNSSIEMTGDSFYKDDIKDLIEPFIYDRLSISSYEVVKVDPISLLTWNRFDLAFRLLYLDLKNKYKGLANQVYYENIKSSNLGDFSLEPDHNIDSFDDYIEKFDKTYESIKNYGFKDDVSLVPLSCQDSIINGAHRVASAIHTGRIISCIKTNEPIMVSDYEYFFNRNVPIKILEYIAETFIEYANDVYIAFLWPSGGKKLKEATTEFDNIVYKKNISLTAQGGFNLLLELYKHMDWVGTLEGGYEGVRKKLIECFPTFDDVTVIAFQKDTIDDVRLIKERIRCLNGIGYSSIHITDTKEEAIRISKLIFNENGLHFLNHADLDKFSVKSELYKIKLELNQANLDPKNILFDGSIILSMYGLRESQDIDILTTEDISKSTTIFEKHDSELSFHEKVKEQLIYDNDLYFQYLGLKFVSFRQLYLMKSNRSTSKDIIDINMMKALINGNKFSMFFLRIKQALFYFKIKFSFLIRMKIIDFLQAIRLYSTVRFIYRWLIKGKLLR